MRNLFLIPIFSTRIIYLLIICLFAAGCGLIADRPTPAPIYVTATPMRQQDTPTPEDTSVVGTEAADGITFPTLEPATITPPPPAKPTLTPSFTDIPTATPTPKGTRPVALKCTTAPQGGFATIFGQDTALQTALGCPVGAALAIGSAALTFDSGSMLWAAQYGAGGQRVIYAIYKNGTFQRYDDTWNQGTDPETTGETAPQGKNTPVRGFGKVWHNNPAVKAGLGWAIGKETGRNGEIQRFERGEMLFVGSLGQTFIFVNGTNTWRATSTGF